MLSKCCVVLQECLAFHLSCGVCCTAHLAVLRGEGWGLVHLARLVLNWLYWSRVFEFHRLLFHFLSFELHHALSY